MVARLPDLGNFEETVMKKTLISFLALGLFAADNPLLAEVDSKHLASVLAAQPEKAQARYPYRHPQETLEFFGIEPGMTVVEALPGGGWYTKILLHYLGSDGQLIGADYAREMYPLFGFIGEEQLKAKDTWIEDFTADAKEWAGDDGARVSAFVFYQRAPPRHPRAPLSRPWKEREKPMEVLPRSKCTRLGRDCRGLDL